MGFDCGFDMYPPLEPTETNQERYEHFIKEVLRTYEADYDGYDDDDDDGNRVAEIIPKGKGAYVEFNVGEHPTMPYNPHMCQYFIRFSSKVSGGVTAAAEPVIRGVYRIAKRRFGERVKWWHECAEAEDMRMVDGWYGWKEVNAVGKMMMKALDGEEVDGVDKVIGGDSVGEMGGWEGEGSVVEERLGLENVGKRSLGGVYTNPRLGPHIERPGNH